MKKKKKSCFTRSGPHYSRPCQRGSTDAERWWHQWKSWPLSDRASIQGTNKWHRLKKGGPTPSDARPALIYLSNKFWRRAKLDRGRNSMLSTQYPLPGTPLTVLLILTKTVILKRSVIIRPIVIQDPYGGFFEKTMIEISVFILISSISFFYSKCLFDGRIN